MKKNNLIILISIIAFLMGIILSIIIGNILNNKKVVNTINICNYVRSKIIKYKNDNGFYPQNLSKLNEKSLIDSWGNNIEMIKTPEIIILYSKGKNKKKDFENYFSDDIFIVILKNKKKTVQE